MKQMRYSPWLILVLAVGLGFWLAWRVGEPD